MANVCALYRRQSSSNLSTSRIAFVSLQLCITATLLFMFVACLAIGSRFGVSRFVIRVAYRLLHFAAEAYIAGTLFHLLWKAASRVARAILAEDTST